MDFLRGDAESAPHEDSKVRDCFNGAKYQHCFASDADRDASHSKGKSFADWSAD